jgi:hypothetical protein
MTASIDMSTPVTRGELRAELEQLEQKLAPLATKAELAALATKAELAALATKAELAGAIAPLATRADLEAWGYVLLDRMQTEMARHFGALQEWISTQLSIVDEKYKDLPERVNRLEATVFGPRRP